MNFFNVSRTRRGFELKAVAVVLVFLAVTALFESQAADQLFGGMPGFVYTYPFSPTNWNATGSQISGPWTNTYSPGSQTSPAFPVIDCSETGTIGVQLSASGTTNTATASIGFIRSTDSVLWETTPCLILSAACPSGAATTVSASITNVGAFRYVTAFAWTNTASISNAVVAYGIIPGRR